MDKKQPDVPSWSTILPRLSLYLPESMFEQLRALPDNFDQLDKKEQKQFASKLISVVRALIPLYRILLQYTPRYLLELDQTPGKTHGEILEGSFLFADVTGFTAMTEMLSQQGKTWGRETMNQIMNQLFTTILDPLTESGGDLLIFAGDAVLAYFPKQANDQELLQATKTALRIERAISSFESYKTEFGISSLTITVGVEHGLAYAGLVGTKRRMELLISGPAIHGATKAEEQGEPGQVILGLQAQTKEIIKNNFTLKGSQVIDDFGDTLGNYEIYLPTRKLAGSAIFGFGIDELLKTLKINLERIEKLSPFLPEDILARLVNAGHTRQLASEFRPVAIQFINIVGIEELALTQGAEFATAVFQRYFTQAQKIVTQHEGVISQVDTYSKGFTLLNTFGTPKAHEGTTVYAVSAALQLSRALEQVNHYFELDPPLQERSGITYGVIFTGEIGAKHRREHVVAGPAVNRAARLMSKAKFGQVIIDSGIWDNVQSSFEGEQLPAINLKGIKGPVVIVNVRQIRHGTALPSLKHPLAGREKEKRYCKEVVKQVQAGQSGVVWMISGETGIGKTSLATYLATTARKDGITVLVGRCRPYSKYLPLFPWIDLLTGWLNTDPHKQRIRLVSELNSLGIPDSENALAELLSLPATKIVEDTATTPTHSEKKGVSSLSSLLSDKMEHTKANRPVGGGLNALLEQHITTSKARKEEFKEEESIWKQLEERVSGPRVIVNLLLKLAKREPLLLILEDTHWLDDESLILLNKMLPLIAELPFMLVITGHKTIVGAEQALQLPLTPLSNKAMVQTAKWVLGANKLDDTLSEWICNQAGGNPLYIAELCRALTQSETVLLDRKTGNVRWTGQAPTIPISLHQLLLARLDELSLAQQDVLKRGAVIGASFGYEILLELCRPQIKKQALSTILIALEQAMFITLENEAVYHFKHPLIHETIYETLSYTQRQSWHTRIADRLTASKQEVAVELVAYHYLHGADKEKAAKFCYLAGNRAKRHGVYMGAIEYYSQLLELSGVSADLQLKAAESMADMLALQEDYTAAEVAYTQAIELGSLSAREKQAIFKGNIEQLVKGEFNPLFQIWAKVAQGWLLYQDEQPETALSIIQDCLPLVEGVARATLERFTQNITDGQPPEQYKVWLHLFANYINSFTTTNF